MTFQNIRIIVPVDFSKLSSRALIAANQVAKLFNGSVTPFHAYIPLTDLDGFHYMGTGLNTKDTLVDIEKVIEKRLNEISADHLDISVAREGIVGIGNPAHALAEESEHYDMVVMSTHGRTGFSRILLGSVAEKVLRLVHKPVLVIENDDTLTPLKKILVTTDFSENSRAAFAHAKEFAEASGADIELFHAVIFDDFDSVEKAEATLNVRRESLTELANQFFSDIPGKVTTKVVTSNRSAHEAILKYTQENPFNLIVIATIGRTGLEYMMMGSTASNVVRTVKTAVLSVNPLK